MPSSLNISELNTEIPMGVFSKGREISVPEEPGLGIDLDEAVVEKYRVG